jgi:hypothetical protein
MERDRRLEAAVRGAAVRLKVLGDRGDTESQACFLELDYAWWATNGWEVLAVVECPRCGMRHFTPTGAVTQCRRCIETEEEE